MIELSQRLHALPGYPLAEIPTLKRRLIESNLRMVVSIARRYAGRGLSLQDLIQEGNIGLQLGIDKYNWHKGFRLSTYVYWWIRQAMTRSLANSSRFIRIDQPLTVLVGGGVSSQMFEPPHHRRYVPLFGSRSSAHI